MELFLGAFVLGVKIYYHESAKAHLLVYIGYFYPRSKESCNIFFHYRALFIAALFYCRAL